MDQKIDRTYREITGYRVPASSIIKGFNIMEDYNEEYFLNIFRSFDISDTVKEQANYFELHYAEANEYLDNIAHQYYESPNLWWVIAMFNDMYNPYEELEEGMQLKILNKKYLYILFKEIAAVSEL